MFLLWLLLFWFGFSIDRSNGCCLKCAECYEKYTNFTEDMVFTSPINMLYKNVSEYLSPICHELSSPECAIQESCRERFNSAVVLFHNKAFCPILDIIKGPLGDCFDKLIPYYANISRRDELMECVWDSIDFNNITEDTPWTGRNDPRAKYQGYMTKSSDLTRSCFSLYHNCTLSMINEKCGPQSVEIILENREIFENGSCTGAEIFTRNSGWKTFVFIKMAELQKQPKYVNDGEEKEKDRSVFKTIMDFF